MCSCCMSEGRPVDQEIAESSVVSSTTAAIPTTKPSGGSIRKVKGEVQFFVLLVIFLCLISIFGGKLLGSWYTLTQESESSGLVVNGHANYGLTDTYFEGEINGESIVENETLKIGYEDWDCYCSETENVMNNVKLLVYLNTIAGLAIIYFLRFQRFNKGRLELFLSLIIIFSLITAIYFATSLPEAIDKDDELGSIYQVQQEDASFISLNSEISSDNGQTVLKAQWFPNIGFFTLIVNIILCIFALNSIGFDFRKIMGSLDN